MFIEAPNQEKTPIGDKWGALGAGWRPRGVQNVG